jgi:hypothetical protein
MAEDQVGSEAVVLELEGGAGHHAARAIAWL